MQNETVKQVKAETQLKQAQTALAWEKVNTQIEITDQLRLAKQFHDVTVGTFVVSSDEAKFYPKPQKFDFSELSKEELIDLVEFSKAVIEIDQKRNDELVRKITEQQHFITQLETRLSEVAK